MKKKIRYQSPSSKKAAATQSVGVIVPPPPVKTYVLDTSVMIHDPHCLTKFGENVVCICSESIQELDKLKTENSDRGQAARMVQRTLLSFFGPSGSMTVETPLPSGGTIFVSINGYVFDKGKRSAGLKRLSTVAGDQKSMDNRILANTIYLAETKTTPVVLVTKDLNLQLKARTIGIPVEDYRYDRVDEGDALTQHRKIEVTPQEMQAFASSGRLTLPSARVEALALNEYVVLSDGKTMPARYNGDGQFVKLIGGDGVTVPDGVYLKPLSLGQQFLLDALLNPKISLITVSGPAGTGKTMFTVGVGLHMLGNRQYTGMSVTRPVVALGEGIGFLPGTMQEKMAPWLQPYFDALTLLLSKRPPLDKKQSRRKEEPTLKGGVAKKPYDALIESGLLEVEALCYIRGRSIPDRLFILDEAQQLTPHQAKTVVTRISKGAKLVLLGDIEQIDNPYVDYYSNGLVYTRDRMRGQAMAATVMLTKGERSLLAETAAKLM